MRVAISIFGREWFALEFGTPAVEDVETDGGYLTATPITFYSSHEIPDEAGLRDRQLWDD